MLTTERLHLIPLTIKEVLLFHTINTDPHVRKYLWDDQVITMETAKTILEESERRMEQDNWGLWKAMKKGQQQCLGYVGLWYFFEEPQPQLIYAFLPEYIRKGYATEASRRIIQYAFEELGYNYLLASTDAPNIPSIKVCEKLGMTLLERREIEEKPTVFYRIQK